MSVDCVIYLANQFLKASQRNISKWIVKKNSETTYVEKEKTMRMRGGGVYDMRDNVSSDLQYNG